LVHPALYRYNFSGDKRLPGAAAARQVLAGFHFCRFFKKHCFICSQTDFNLTGAAEKPEYKGRWRRALKNTRKIYSK
jgi:hypothetical protein